MITSPEQARRIDRLARGAHLFHRYAHHPLCDAYAGEVIRVGVRTRLCRGCTCAAAGSVAGIPLGLATRAPTSLLLAWIALAVLLGLASFPRRSRGSSSSPRWWSKLFTRAAPAALLAWAAASGLRAGAATGWLVALLAAAVLAGTVAAYRHRRPDRTACDACPERSSGTTCTGLLPIARREAAFARAAGRILVERGPPASRASRRRA